MNNLFRKNRSLFGKVFLLALLAPLAAIADDSNDALLPKDILELKKTAKSDMASKCQASQQVNGGKETCEKPYKATIEAVDDYGRKLAAHTTKQDAKGIASTANCTASEKCQAGTKDVAATAAASKKEESKANQGLANWIKETGNQAKNAGDAIRSAMDTGTADSGVTRQAADEHDQAKAFADKAAQKLQAEAAKNDAAAKQAEKTADSAGKKETSMDSTPSDKAAASKASDATKQAAGAGGGAGSGAGGAPSIPSAPSSSAGAASGNPSDIPNADSAMAGQDSLARNDTNTAKNDSGSKSTKKDLNLDATPGKIDATSQAADGAVASTGSSKIDTSLRDSLKKKLLGDQTGEGGSGGGDALGGMPFGGGAGGSKNAKPGEPGYVAGASSSEHGGGDFGSGGGGSESGGDFSMARSETDAAVKNLINEFNTPGNEAGRNLADIDSSGASGIEGIDGGNLFLRIRGTINRHVQKGDVVNGVNGKI